MDLSLRPTCSERLLGGNWPLSQSDNMEAAQIFRFGGTSDEGALWRERLSQADADTKLTLETLASYIASNASVTQ